MARNMFILLRSRFENSLVLEAQVWMKAYIEKAGPLENTETKDNVPITDETIPTDENKGLRLNSPFLNIS